MGRVIEPTNSELRSLKELQTLIWKFASLPLSKQIKKKEVVFKDKNRLPRKGEPREFLGTWADCIAEKIMFDECIVPIVNLDTSNTIQIAKMIVFYESLSVSIYNDEPITREIDLKHEEYAAWISVLNEYFDLLKSETKNGDSFLGFDSITGVITIDDSKYQIGEDEAICRWFECLYDANERIPFSSAKNRFPKILEGVNVTRLNNKLRKLVRRDIVDANPNGVRIAERYIL